MYEEYVSLRFFFLFFFSPSATAVFFGALEPSEVLVAVLVAVFEGVGAGALPAVDAGLTAI